jgi:hypothetical protein
MGRPTHARMSPAELATFGDTPLPKPTTEEVIEWKTIAVRPSIS